MDFLQLKAVPLKFCLLFSVLLKSCLFSESSFCYIGEQCYVQLAGLATLFGIYVHVRLIFIPHSHQKKPLKTIQDYLCAVSVKKYLFQVPKGWIKTNLPLE